MSNEPEMICENNQKFWYDMTFTARSSKVTEYD